MIRGALIALLICMSATYARAQNTRLTLGGFGGNFGVATSDDFSAGYRESSSASAFTVVITNANTRRNTTVFISAQSSTAGSGKPIADLLWRRDDLSAWNPMTTTNVLVESQTIQSNGTSWSNSIWFRYLLDWENDAPAAYSATITLTLVVSAP